MMDDDLICWLCERPLGKRTQWHHTVPKSKKGRETVPVHPICHNAIHANFTNAELARFGDDRGIVLTDEAILKFVRWIKGKPPDFYAKTRNSR